MSERYRSTSEYAPKETIDESFRFVVHGSYKEENWPLVQQVRDFFVDEGLELVAPFGDVIGYEAGFAVLSGEEEQDTRVTHFKYLQHVKELAGGKGFSYFVNHKTKVNEDGSKTEIPGVMGGSQTVEYGVAMAKGVPAYLHDMPSDQPMPIPENSVMAPDELTHYIKKHKSLPPIQFSNSEVHALWSDLQKTDHAVGAIMEYSPPKGEKEIFVVQTDQWEGKWSIVGQRLRPGQTLHDGLFEGIHEETSNDTASNPQLLTAFSQIPNSGYHRPAVSLNFTDFVVEMGSKRFTLNDEAQRGIWVPSRVALSELELEPNARKTIEAYQQRTTSTPLS
jgi:ADP-ribose pyrophosphatase YjhB (NUDIX family)